MVLIQPRVKGREHRERHATLGIGDGKSPKPQRGGPHLPTPESRWLCGDEIVYRRVPHRGRSEQARKIASYSGFPNVDRHFAHGTR